MPVTLNKCTNENCDPKIQVRGKMGSGDYISHSLRENPETYHNEVELIDDNHKSDVRICCKPCGTVTGWQKADAPGMPGAGLDYLVKTWNENNGI